MKNDLMAIVLFLAVAIALTIAVLGSRTIEFSGELIPVSTLRTEMACMPLSDEELQELGVERGSDPITCNYIGADLGLLNDDGEIYPLVYAQDAEPYYCGGVETWLENGWEDVYDVCDEGLVMGAQYRVQAESLMADQGQVWRVHAFELLGE